MASTSNSNSNKDKDSNSDDAAQSLLLPGSKATNASTFIRTFATLSSKSSPQGRCERQSSWSEADPNSNSYISLAEIDTFILNRLIRDHGDDGGMALYREYRPCYILAFNAAKNVAPPSSSSSSASSSGKGGISARSGKHDDYITKREFRLFFVFLILHVQLLDAFAIVDGGEAGVDDANDNDDRRITQTEFFDASHLIANYGFVGLADVRNSPYEIFKNMDANDGGVVLLKEWCDYLLEEERKGGTDVGRAVSVVDVAGAASAVTPRKDSGTRTTRSRLTPTPGKKTPTRSSTTKPKPKPKPIHTTPSKSANVASAKKKKAKDTTASTATTPSATQSSFRKPGPSADLNLFLSTFHPLVSLTDPSAKRDRSTQWKNADPNSNGMLSLAEVDSWIKLTLQATHKSHKGNQLYRLYRPSYIHAFDAAKSLAGGSTDEYVTKKEFRLLNAYLCIYAEMMDAFAAIDGGGPGVDSNDDRRIGREEWMRGHHTVSTYDLIKLHKITDEEAGIIFTEMDVNGGGYVLLNEWVGYLAKAEVAAETEKGVVLAKTAAYRNVMKASEEATRRVEEDEKKRRTDAAEAEAKRIQEENRAAMEKAATEEAEAAKRASAAKGKAEAERIEQERIAAEKAEAERLEAERLEAERLAKEKAEAERMEQERIAAEKTAEEERLEQERLEKERLERERIAAEKAEAARLEAERLAKEKAEAERLEQERIAAEKKAEEERLEKERVEQERIEAKKEEAERLAKEEAEAERLEQERIAAEKAEAEEIARLEEEERMLMEEEAELARLEEEERIVKEKIKAEQEEEERIAKALEEKAKMAESLNAELQQEGAAVPEQAAAAATTSLSSFASSFKAAAPMASSLKAAAGSSLAAAAAKASSLAAAVNKEDEE